MFDRKVNITNDSKKFDPDSENAMDSKIIMSDRGTDIKIKENKVVTPGTFELKENGATYGVGSEMLRNLKKFFLLGLKNKRPFPTLLLWYKGLSKEQKKSVMIISKERTENDSSKDRKMEE